MKQAFLKSLDIQEKTFPLENFMTLGKDSLCQMILDDNEVSDRHARIEFKENSMMLVKDLRSQSGTYVNGARIMEAYLTDGDILRIGTQEWVVLEQLPSDQPDDHFPLSSRNDVWNDELKTLGHVAKTEFPVLLLGPSGTGKDVIAHGLHVKSARHRAPFISVNCSALNENLIESELFGHIKGSFTGAIADRKGAFESARGGTLFLDEIGDLSYGLQAKLLRALENSEIRPVGADYNVRTDVRIIAATHQNLATKIHEGAFRSDLYYRLNVISVSPPALNCRMEDFESLLYDFAKKLKVRFSYGAIARLKKHPWPGNIRELKNLVSRAAAIYPRLHIQEEHIEKLLDKTLMQQNEDRSHNIPVIKEIERQMIIKRLHQNKGNQRRTAQDLGMPKSTLHDRLKYYNIDVGTFKA